MDDLRQTLIETLIFEGAQTASQLADSLSQPLRSVNDCLGDLVRSGQVRCVVGSRLGDRICPNCQTEYQDAEPGDRCDLLDWCQGYLIDDCKWVFCGGPVSQVLSLTQQNGEAANA